MINLIFACDKNNCIGKDNKLPWHIPEDLRMFLRFTQGHTVVMGRKTYESLPTGIMGLPGRRNVVLSTTLEENDHIEVIDDLEQYLEWALDYSTQEVWIIGGAEVYRQSIPYVTNVVQTVVDMEVEDGDTWFDLAEFPHFQVYDSTHHLSVQGDTPIAFTVNHYRAIPEYEL